MTATDLTFSAFSRVLNTVFLLVDEPGNRMKIELIEVVNELEGKTAPPGYDAFSLIFRAAHSEPLNQRIYSLEHDEMGVFDVFLVPVRQDATGVDYQAVFTRLEDG